MPSQTPSPNKNPLSNTEILDKEGVIIIVKSCNIEYKKSAKFEDEIEVVSKISEVKNSSFKMLQVIKKKSDIISEDKKKLEFDGKIEFTKLWASALERRVGWKE